MLYFSRFFTHFFKQQRGKNNKSHRQQQTGRHKKATPFKVNRVTRVLLTTNTVYTVYKCVAVVSNSSDDPATVRRNIKMDRVKQRTVWPISVSMMDRRLDKVARPGDDQKSSGGGNGGGPRKCCKTQTYGSIQSTAPQLVGFYPPDETYDTHTHRTRENGKGRTPALLVIG